MRDGRQARAWRPFSWWSAPRTRNADGSDPKGGDAVTDALSNTEAMTEHEARACIELIKQSVEDVRDRIYELHAREGWAALGYSS